MSQPSPYSESTGALRAELAKVTAERDELQITMSRMVCSIAEFGALIRVCEKSVEEAEGLKEAKP